jgi:hypothetical protein
MPNKNFLLKLANADPEVRAYVAMLEYQVSTLQEAMVLWELSEPVPTEALQLAIDALQASKTDRESA